MELYEIPAALQSRLRELRGRRSLTQADLADILLCDQSLYSKYERGERPLPRELAVTLAGAGSRETGAVKKEVPDSVFQ